jgi:hypothetical protein
MGDVFLEGQLRARKQADRHIGLIDRSKAAGDGIGKSGRNQLVTDFGRSGGNIVQAIVTHGRYPLFVNSRIGCPSDGIRTDENGDVPAITGT